MLYVKFLFVAALQWCPEIDWCCSCLARYDVVQGIMARPDALEVIGKVHLAILPLGSGNGLANSILSDPANGACRTKALNSLLRNGVTTCTTCMTHTFFDIPTGFSIESKHERSLKDACFLVARNKVGAWCGCVHPVTRSSRLVLTVYTMVFLQRLSASILQLCKRMTAKYNGRSCLLNG